MKPPVENVEIKLANLLRQMDELADDKGGDDSVLVEQLQKLSVDQIEQLTAAKGCLALLEGIRDMEQGPTQYIDATVGATFETVSVFSDRPLEQLGRYQIQKLVGEGGFARVFKAYDPDLERIVALKIPKPNALVTEEARIRFQRESRAVATLEHPAIIPVFEAGIEDHISYIAMAFCPGQSLANYLQNNPGRANDSASFRESAAIVSKVAGALAHAHSRNIIHRDVKPGNILLAGDCDGDDDKNLIVDRVRITDFGLVKFENERSQIENSLTTDGAIIGTPAYMSPEQAHGQETVSPASDIYSLGTVFYELLTGSVPHRKPTHVATMISIERDIPARPRKINRLIPKDLEAICLKCLEKESTRRYQSAFELSEDLDHWMAGKPIKARHISSIERFWRWCRRQPLVAGAISFALVCLIGGTVVSTGKWRDAELKRLVAEDATKLAKQESKRANDALTAMISSFEMIDPRQGAKPDLSAVEVLVRSHQRILEQFAEDPVARARLLDALARAFTGVGDYQHALQCRQDRYQELKSHKGQLGVETLDALSELAGAENNAGNLLRSLECRELHLELTTKKMGPSHSKTVSSMTRLGKIYLELGKLDEAVSLQLKSSLLAESSADFGLKNSVTNNLAESFQATGQMMEAIRIMETELESVQSALGEGHRDTIETMAMLAQAYRTARRRKKAVALQTKVVDLATQTYGEADPVTLQHIDSLANYHPIGPDDSLAIETAKHGYQLAKSKLGDNHPMTIYMHGRYGFALSRIDRHDEAIETLEQLLPQSIEVLGIGDHRTVSIMLTLSTVYRQAAQPHKSLELAKKALGLAVAKVGEHHWTSILAMKNLGYSLFAAGQMQQASSEFEEVIRICFEKHGEGNIKLNRARVWCIYASLAARDYATVERISLEFLNNSVRPLSEDREIARTWLAISLFEQGKFAEAREVLVRLADIQNHVFPWHQFSENLRGAMLVNQREFEQAESIMIESFEQLTEQLDDAFNLPHQRDYLFRCSERIVELYQRWEKPEIAAVWTQKITDLETKLNQIPFTINR